MSQMNRLRELTDHEAEAAGGSACQRFVIYLDTDGDNAVDEMWIFQRC